MLLKDLWEEAPLVAFGLDYPATDLPFPQISPLHGIEIGCTRRASGATQGEPLPPANQRITLADMLAGYPVNGARQLFGGWSGGNGGLCLELLRFPEAKRASRFSPVRSFLNFFLNFLVFCLTWVGGGDI